VIKMNVHVEIKPGVLTPQETEVAKLSFAGFARKVIAKMLGISPSTVNTHTESILRKFGAHNIPHAFAIALAEKIVTSVTKVATKEITKEHILIFCLFFGFITNAMEDDFRLRSPRGRHESIELTEYMD